MNLARMHISAALRQLPLWLVIGGLNCGMLLGLLQARAAGRAASPAAGELAALGWVGIALFLAMGTWRQRASVFELALPVAARRLWLQRVAGTLAVAVVLALSLVLVAVAQVRLLGSRGELDFAAAPIVAFLVGASILGLGLLELPHRTMNRLPLTARTVGWTITVLGGLGLLLVPLARLGTWAALVPAALGAIVLGILWRGVPAAYTLQSRAAGPAAASDAASRRVRSGDAAVTTRHVLGWTLARSLALTPKDALAYPIILFFGLVMGGTLTLWTGDADMEDLRFFYIPMATYVLFTLTGPRLTNLHHLDPLPVTRRRVLAWLLLPYLGCFLLGYGAGALFAAWRAPAPALVQIVESEDSWRVWVPMWARHIDWDGNPPAIRHATGEAHVPRGLPLWRGARVVVYSPYDTPAGSSLDYVAEQLSRATAVLYGKVIPAPELAARYLELGLDGRVAPKPGGLRLLADYPDLRSRSAGPLMPLFVALVAVPWLLLTAGLFRTYRPDIGPARGQQFVWGIIGLFVVVTVILAALVIRHVVQPWASRAVLGIAAQHLGGLPAGVAAVWLGALVLLGLGYALVAQQFRRMEVPTRPLRFTLVDWSREGG